MEASNIQEKAMDAMIAMNAAIQRLRLFPASSPSTVDSIDKAYRAISDVFQGNVPFSVVKTGRGVSVCGMPLEEKVLRKAQVTAFLDLFFGFGVRSLILDPLLERAELSTVLELLAEKPESMEKRGGLSVVIAAAHLDHVLVDAAPTGRTSAAFPGANDVESMLISLERILTAADAAEREAICRHLARAVMAWDDETVCTFLARKMDGNFREPLLAAVLEGLDDARYERLLSFIRLRREAMAHEGRLSADGGGEAFPPDMDAAWRHMTGSSRGRRLLESMNRSINHRIKSGMERLFKGENRVFQDAEFLQALPDVIDRFLGKGNLKTAEGIIDRLSAALDSEDSEVRANAASILSRTMGRLITDPIHAGLMQTLSRKMAGWLRTETRMSRSYAVACSQLGEVARILIQDKNFDGCRPVLEALNFIHASQGGKAEGMIAAARKALREIADAQLTGPLLDDLGSGDEEIRKQAADRLILLGAAAMEALLRRLRESPAKKERSRIIRVIDRMGRAALPDLEAAVVRESSWYYVRNLILLFGKVGVETHLPIISPFLEHQDLRVRREALNSIYTIGGKEGRRRVLQALPRVDDDLKLNIIGLLGAWQEREAAAPLMALLESETLSASKLQNQLAERICTALAGIGAPEAVPILREIAENRKKGVFAGGKGYADSVRVAAQDAIDAIEKKTASAPSGSPAASGSEQKNEAGRIAD